MRTATVWAIAMRSQEGVIAQQVAHLPKSLATLPIVFQGGACKKVVTSD